MEIVVVSIPMNPFSTCKNTSGDADMKIRKGRQNTLDVNVCARRRMQEMEKTVLWT